MKFLRGKPKDRESIKPGGVRVTDHRQFVELVRKLAEAGGCKIDVYQRVTPNTGITPIVVTIHLKKNFPSVHANLPRVLVL